MFHHWNHFDNQFSALNRLHGMLDQVLRSPASNDMDGLNASVYDAGEHYLVSFDVPGITEDSIELDVHGTTLTMTVSGSELTLSDDESLHRRERRPVRFKRSLSLPDKVDPEQVRADLSDGVLCVKLAKSPDAKPRRIAIGR